LSEKVLEAWETKGRVYVRGLDGDYDLKEERRRIRALPRVLKTSQIPFKGGPRMFNKVILDPKYGGTQTIYLHMKVILPGTESQLHGHQNDALLYILDGSGFSTEDGVRYDWKAGDMVIVQAGVVHQHFCTSEVPARILIIKSKSLAMFANLTFQGLVTPANKESLPGWEGYKPED